MAVPGIGSAIGAGVGLIGSIIGGVGAANQRRRMADYLNRQDSQNQAWYNANALSDYTQRADSQNLMKQLRDTLDRNTRRAAGAAVVTGATPEQQAVQKEAANRVITDTFSNIGAMGQRWKDNITNQYLARRENIANQRMGSMEGAARSYENLMSSGLNMLAGSAGNLLSSGQSTTPWGSRSTGNNFDGWKVQLGV